MSVDKAHSKVVARINGHRYEVLCEIDDREKTQKLVDKFTAYVEETAESAGQIGQAPLMILATLEMLSELDYLRRFNRANETSPVFYYRIIRKHYSLLLKRVAERLAMTADYLEEKKRNDNKPI